MSKSGSESIGVFSRADEVAEHGTGMVFLHWGHLPFLPACVDGTRICLPQKEQVNRIVDSDGFWFGELPSIADLSFK
ncbi:MAG: hypothetical protein ABSG97_00425 [Sedimentisphaerales bacterium]|jgi:hypothetical protein